MAGNFPIALGIPSHKQIHKSHGLALLCMVTGEPYGAHFNLARPKIDFRHRRPVGILGKRRAVAELPSAVVVCFSRRMGCVRRAETTVNN